MLLVVDVLSQLIRPVAVEQRKRRLAEQYLREAAMLFLAAAVMRSKC